MEVSWFILYIILCCCINCSFSGV